MVTVENLLPAARKSDATFGGAAARSWSRFVPGAVIALAFVPILVLHGRELWARPHYQFFPLVIPGAAALVWKWCGRLGRLEPGNPALGKGAAVLAWLMLAFGVACLSPGVGALAALFALITAAYTLGGWRLTAAALPAWGLLWLAIPPPRHLDVVLIVKLQNMVSRWSSQLLDLIGVYHMMDGNVVDVGGAPLLVDQACSGVYSLITLLIGTLFYALWVRTPLVRTAILMLAAVAWVLFGNLLRIITVVVLTTRWEINAATGWRHEFLGLLVFALMLGLVLSTDRLLSYVQGLLRWSWALAGDLRRERVQVRASPEKSLGALNFRRRASASSSRTRRPADAGSPAAASLVAASPPVPVAATVSETDPGPRAPDDPGRTELPDPRTTWLGSWGFAAAFGLLFIPQMMMPGANWKDVLLAADVYPALFKSLDGRSLDPQVGPFRFQKFDESDRSKDSSWGEHSKSWIYEGPASYAAVSLDYEFVDWHELTDCYRAQGWVMQKRKVLSPETPAGPGAKGPGRPFGPVVAAWFVNSEGRHKYLLFGLYDRKGRAIEPNDTRSVVTDFGHRLKSWFRTGDAGGSDAEVLCYQLQTFVDTEVPLSEAGEQIVLGLHASARSRVEELVLKPRPTEGGGR